MPRWLHMQLRKAHPQDQKAILQLAELLRLDIPNFVWATPEYITRQINNGEYFVGEEEETLVAIISFRPRQGILYIETLTVAPEHRSAGLGGQLISFAKQHAKASGFPALRACAFFEYGNQTFYEKQGFLPLGKPGTYNGHKFHRFELRL